MANHGPVYGLDADLKAKQDAKYDSQIEAETRAWVEAVTGEKITNFHDDLKDGVTLCNLMNKIRPGLVKKINKQKTPFMMMENIGFFLKGCAALGVNKVDQFMTVDLYEAKNLGQVIHCIHALGRHVSNSSSYSGPLLGTSVELRKTLSRSGSRHSSGVFDLQGMKTPSNEGPSTETTPRTSVDVDQLRAKEQQEKQERELQQKLQREADERAKQEKELQEKNLVEQKAKEAQAKEKAEREKQEHDRVEKEAQEKRDREAREAQAAKEKEEKKRRIREALEKQEEDRKKTEADQAKKEQEENERKQREAQIAKEQANKEAALRESKAREEEAERRQRDQARKEEEASTQPPDAEPAQANYNVVITWSHETSASDKLYVAGTFSGWQKVEMTKKSPTSAILELNLTPGAYQYKFIVNDDWKCDPNQPTQTDGSGNVNNQVVVA